MAPSQRPTPQYRHPASSIYPLHPPGSRRLARVSESQLTAWDRLLVGGSSLVIVGSTIWVPSLLLWAYRRWKRVVDRRRKAIYASLVLAAVGLYVWGPHRHSRVGTWLQVRHWRLWKAWVRFVALEVILDQPQNERRPGNERIELKQEDAILAFLPHGIFPFAFGVGALTEAGQAIFGPFRPIIASAAKKVPVLTEIIAWLHGLDASRSTVDRALSRGDRVGVVPGGISEMFAGFPKPECHPDEEIAIVRKGFLRMALQHQRPVVPIYCFGATKMFRRWQLPALESLSNLLRMSLIVFYGVGGLPIPFRQRLTYVVGDPVVPPPLMGQDEAQVEALHQQFCQELQRLFERHKEAYGWGHKTLQLLSK